LYIHLINLATEQYQLQKQQSTKIRNDVGWEEKKIDLFALYTNLISIHQGYRIIL
jgi:hypothetical protein